MNGENEMKLAVHGGVPVRTRPFPAYNTMGKEEKEAVMRVLDSGILSKFLGCWDSDFYGGPEVRALEKDWAEYFGVRHAIAVNSATSGLYTAAGTVGIGPGDEVIVSPYTMSASATAPLIYGAVPVFADIEEDYFCLDPKSVEERITKRTRAIIVVDIFGLPYDADAINAIAKKHDLFVIEDTAQAPGALYKRKFAGTLSDIGVFSLNYHKHIHCGEGGIIVTDNDELAERARLIRNHAEAVVEEKGVTDLCNMIGFNFRMTEIEATITRCQLKKLDSLVREQQGNCEYLAERLMRFPAIIPPRVRAGCTHVYYAHPFRFDEGIAGLHRNDFIQAVRAELPATSLREPEGPLIGYGYVKPIYLQPLYQKRLAHGKRGFPFMHPWYDGQVDYSKGICPVTERMHEKEFFSHEMMRPGMSREDLDDVVAAFEKVWENRKSLQK